MKMVLGLKMRIQSLFSVVDREGPAGRIRERPCAVFRAVSLFKVSIAVAMVPMSGLLSG